MQRLEPYPQLNEVYVSPRGSKFRIQMTDGRLFSIVMENGGIRPPLCNEKYTSFKKAKMAIEKYFKNNPKPEPREKSKRINEPKPIVIEKE